MKGNSNQDDPKADLPKDLQRLPKFGSSKKNKKIQKKVYKAVEPIDYPSEKNFSQKLALSALKYSGQTSLKPEIEDTARDLLEINKENNLGTKKNQLNNLDKKDDTPPAPFV
jgi:hypothetical protein